MSFNFFVKSNITFGRGAVEKLPEIIAGYGLKNIEKLKENDLKSEICKNILGFAKKLRNK